MPFRILVVCTANAARSPLIEMVLARELERLRPGSFVVSSAGTRARSGTGMATGSRALLLRSGIDYRPFSSRLLTPSLLSEVELVIGAERAHVSAVLAERPGLLKRTFTFLELARIADSMPERTSECPDPRAFVGYASARRMDETGTASADFDLADPVGRDPENFEVLGRAVQLGIPSIVRGLAGAR